MAGLINSLWFFFRFNPIRFALLILLVLTITIFVAHGFSFSGGYPVGHKHSYWIKFLPLAQAGLAISLAYLALPYFRHAEQVADDAQDLIGKTKNERKTFAENLLLLPANELKKIGEIHAVVNIYSLIEYRNAARAGRRIESDDPKGYVQGKRYTWGAWDQTHEHFKETCAMTCIREDAARTKFLKTFFVSADTTVVILGATLACLVHIAAIIDEIWILHPHPIFLNPYFQVLLASILGVWTSVVPAYFAFHSSRLSANLAEFLNVAGQQRVAFAQEKVDEAEKLVTDLLTDGRGRSTVIPVKKSIVAALVKIVRELGDDSPAEALPPVSPTRPRRRAAKVGTGAKRPK